ncbi:hypothetical protein Tco_1340471, partial [Tanacetum coccineum]
CWEGELVDLTGAGASSTRTGEATLPEGEKNSSNTVETQDLIHASMVVQTVLKEEGLERVLNRMLQKQVILNGDGPIQVTTDEKALPSSWNNVALIMRNKDGIDDLDIDDLYNNLKVFEADVQKVIVSIFKLLECAFPLTADIAASMKLNNANGVSTALDHNSQGQASSLSYTDDLMFSFFANQSNSPQLDDEDLENEDAGYRSRDNTRRTVPVETSNALVIQDNALIGLTQRYNLVLKNYCKTYELKISFDEQRQTLSKANLEIVAYQLGLESVEAPFYYNALISGRNRITWGRCDIP